MLKSCLKLLVTGIILIFVGFTGICVMLGVGMISPDDLSIDFAGSTNSYVGEAPYNNENFIDLNEKANDITKLDIDIGMGSFYIEKGDEFSISTYDIDPGSFEYNIYDGCLTVKYSPTVKLMSFDFLNFDGGGSSIYLYVPEKVYDSVNLNMTAGDFYVNSISAKQLSTESSAGSMYLTEVASDNTTLKMTAGDVTVSNSTLKDIFISMNAGEMYLNDCKIYGDNKIKMTAGELIMSLVGNRRDYSINIDKALGNVYIDGMDTGVDYAETTTMLTEVVTTQTGGSLEQIDNGDTGVIVGVDISENEITKENTDNEKPNGSIDINITAGNCYIEFLGGNDYE